MLTVPWSENCKTWNIDSSSPLLWDLGLHYRFEGFIVRPRKDLGPESTDLLWGDCGEAYHLDVSNLDCHVSTLNGHDLVHVPMFEAFRLVIPQMLLGMFEVCVG